MVVPGVMLFAEAALLAAGGLSARGGAAPKASLPAGRVPDAPVPVRSERRPIDVGDLVAIADIGAPLLSPDGTQAVYRVTRSDVDTNGARFDWYIVAADGRHGQALHIGGGGALYDGAGALIDQTPVWDPDSTGVWYPALVDGIVGLWHWNGSGKAQRRIVDDADIIHFALTNDGKHLVYQVRATRAAIMAAEERIYAEGALVDVHLDLTEPVAGGVIRDGRRVMQRLPAEWFDRKRLLWDAPLVEKHVAIEGLHHSAAVTALAPTLQPQQPADARRAVAVDGDIAEIVRNEAGQRVTISRGTRKIRECVAGPCASPRLAALAWTQGDKALLMFEADGSAREHVWLWQTASAPRRIATTDGARRSPYRPPRCAIGAEALLCAESHPTVPPRLVRIAYADGSRTILADPNAPIARRIRATARRLDWGPDVTGILLTPTDAARPYPLVIQYYNCAGFLKGGVGDEIPMLPLTEHGIAVLCMHRTKRPTRETFDATYALALADIERAVAGLAAEGLVDPARVGIGGLSFGSEVALWAIRKSQRFAAATLSSGQISNYYYWANALPGRGFAANLKQYWGLGDPDSDAERWKLLTAEGDVAAIRTPVLMQLPEAEARYVVEFHSRMKIAGKAIDLFAFADEPHVKYQPVHKHAVYARNLDWYRFWLKGEEDMQPAKAGQYARWRSYRDGQSLPAPSP